MQLPPMGCSFLRNVEVSGSGYLFSNGRFIREYNHCSDVALARLQDENYGDNPFVNLRQNRVTINEPVLLFTGPGHNTYGHWLLDFLPRLFIAQKMLGLVLNQFPILLPSGTPSWAAGMMQEYCNIAPAQLLYYSETDDLVICNRVCIPTCGHNGQYAMHPLVRETYARLGGSVAPEAKRKICLSRRSFSLGRAFAARETFERMAAERGFDIVCPEELNFTEQAALFRSASCILGENGSGLHASVFADPGTIVASVGFNWVQCHVNAAFEQPLINLNRVQMLEPVPGEPQRFTTSEDDLYSLFDMIERVQQHGLQNAITGYGDS